MSSGTATFAVGKPSSGPPRPSPARRGRAPREGARAGGRPLRRRPGQQRADPGGGDRLAPLVGQPHADDLEAVAGPQLAQERDVALAPVPEVEVLAHHDQARPELVDQDLLDEVFGRLVRPLLVEGDHQRAVDAAVGQQLELLVEARELFGRGVGPHHRGGMAVERDHHGREPGVGGTLAQVAEQGAVAPVDPVVGPDGDGGTWSRGIAMRVVGARQCPATTTAGRMRSVSVAS